MLSKLKSVLGRSLWLAEENHVVAKDGFAAGGDGKPSILIPGNPDYVAVFDDFLGDTGRDLTLGTDANWRIVDDDTGATSKPVITNLTGGVLRFPGGTPTPVQVKRAVKGGLCWKGNQGSIPTDGKGGLRLGARVKIDDIKDTGFGRGTYWVGFTDTLANELPVGDTGGVLISIATNAFGVLWSSAQQGDTGFVAHAVNGGTDATPVPLGVSPAAGVYSTIEMELHHGPSDTGGTATFYIDGVAKGSIPGPVAMNVALSPTVIHWGDTGGTVLDIDWIAVSAPRDTGV
jgi:hypothetical protein